MDHGRRPWPWSRPAGLLFSVVVAAVGVPVVSAGQQIPGFHGSVALPQVPAVNALPQARELVRGVRALEMPGVNHLVVHQVAPKAVIDWQSFDIGSDATVHFDQKGNADWEVLNRILDQSPSQIFGRLTADGRVYLINPNGILFSAGAKVNVHGLVASALDIDVDDFVLGLQRFHAGPEGEAGSVVNDGVIETDALGSVVLIGGDVENGGRITAPLGKIVLVAGDQVAIASDGVGGLAVERSTAAEGRGVAVNREAGSLAAESGWAGMFGRLVNQEGRVEAVTAIRRNGKIVLAAEESVTTGPHSTTATPISVSGEAEHESFVFSGGQIDVSGNRIDHQGTLSAPSGTINLTAGERVYLDAGSTVDVSGSWVERPAARNVVRAQLNSVELRDDFGQKDGLLQGATVAVDVREVSAIGDVSGSLTGEELTAAERSTAAGNVTITSRQGDIILREGATLGFAGGGFRYRGGMVETTKLLSGERLYDLSDAPQWLAYDAVLDRQERVHERYGVTDAFTGLFTGGATPLRELSPAYVQGDDAGQVVLVAPHVVLDGDLLGGVVQGFYQTGELDGTGAVDRREPVGGNLTIGAPPGDVTTPENQDFVTGDVTIVADRVALPLDFDLSAPLPGSTTTLAARELSKAGLSALTLRSNTRVKIAEGVDLRLAPGGTLQVTGREIDDAGEIHIPSGQVVFILEDNRTSFPTLSDGGVENGAYVELNERAHLASTSVIATAGEQVDNSTAGAPTGAPLRAARTSGGDIAILDQIDSLQGSVEVEPGARLDVGGGYQIGHDGHVAGGDGGRLTLQGATLVVQGDLRGHALPDRSGGSLVLHAGETRVTALAPSAPAAFNRGKLVVAGDHFADSGFTHIDLRAAHDLIVQAGATIAPSRTHLAVPVAGAPTDAGAPVRNLYVTQQGRGRTDGLTTVAEADVGDASVSLSAGRRFTGLGHLEADTEAAVEVAAGATVEATPGGRVTIKAPAVTVDGRLAAPAGAVEVEATQHDLLVGGEAEVVARGYNRPDRTPVAEGLAAGFVPEAGGEVVLTATNGDVRLLAGGLVDVSGSTPVVQQLRRADTTLDTFLEASPPGGVSISYGGALELAGELRGRAALEGLPGGALTLASTAGHTDPSSGRPQGLTIDSDLLANLQGGGFDDLTFRSFDALWLGHANDPAVGRRLTLDAPVIQGDGSRSVVLSAPWIRLLNSRPDHGSTTPQAAETRGELELTGEFIDVEGDLVLGGFDHVRLTAGQDLRLADHRYRLGNGDRWLGRLATDAAQLTLQADRIYPTTLSRFMIASPGRVTTLAGDPFQGPPPSAGGHLTIAADEIQHGGVLAAPQGSISLGRRVTTRTEAGAVVEDVEAADRIYLAPGSLITTAGDQAVAYGALASQRFWTVPDKANPANAFGLEVKGAPPKSVTVAAGEVVVDHDATIDVSGGGSLFTYQFLPSVAGSVDPLRVGGRQVILADGSVVLPGPAVHLDGGAGVAAGTYSLLPEAFAFLPGAYVIAPVAEGTVPGGNQVSREGYPLVTGYETETATDLRAPRIAAYAVRPAAAVLAEGSFLRPVPVVAGDAGAVRLSGETNLFNGAITGTALPGHVGGSLTLVGREITVGLRDPSLVSGVRVGDLVPAELRGQLLFDPALLGGQSIEELTLGDPQTTRSIIVEGGGLAGIPRVTLMARDEIHLTDGARIDGGQATLLVPSGRITIDPGAAIHAADDITLDARKVDLLGLLQVDNSALTFAADRIFILPDDEVTGLGDGLYLTPSLWHGFQGVEEVSLLGRSEIDLLGGVEIPTLGTLNLDTPLLRGDIGGGDVRLTGEVIHLRNSSGGGALSGSPGDGKLTLAATREVRVGGGDVAIDGFSGIALESGGPIIFEGRGSLTTDADTTLSATRITAGSELREVADGSLTFTVADFAVDAGRGRVAIDPAVQGAAGEATRGGRLAIRGRSIDHRGRVDIPGGDLILTATGSADGEGIFLHDGATIASRGTKVEASLATGDQIAVGLPGGRVRLMAPDGTVEIAGGATLDVSAGEGPAAGGIELIAPTHGVVVDGTLAGRGPAGGGGDFRIACGDGALLDPLLQRLAAGGFDGDLALAFATGDLVVGADVRATSFALATGGSLIVDGTIGVASAGGAEIRLAAADDLTLAAGGRLTATDTAGAEGGRVDLRAAGGTLTLAQGSVIDVAGGGALGRVILRGPRDDGDGSDESLRMALAGAVTGAGEVVVEATRRYGASELQRPDRIGAADLARWQSDAAAFMDHAGTIRSDLLAPLVVAGSGGSLHLMPGIEVAVDGDLTLTTPIDLTTWRFAGEPGVLSLRAGGDLLLDRSIVDHPTDRMVQSATAAGRDSWEVSVVAGADVGSADLRAVRPSAGDLRLADGAVLYSESAPLTLVAGGDVHLGTGAVNPFMVGLMAYAAGTYDGALRVVAENDVDLAGGVLQTATGDLQVTAGGNVALTAVGGEVGAIRSTGTPTARPGVAPRLYFLFTSDYAGGGDIHVTAGGAISGSVTAGAWDGVDILGAWSASYGQAGSRGSTRGIAAMAGGDVSLDAGADVDVAAGTFGTGDLRITAGGDVDGRFLVADGAAEIVAGGNFGRARPGEPVEMFDAAVAITALGNIDLGTVVNPTIARTRFNDANTWDLGYGVDSGVTLTALTGDVAIAGNSSFYGSGVPTTRERLLPPRLTVRAGRDITFGNDLALAPAAGGNLTLVAGRDIDGERIGKDGVRTVSLMTKINLSDLDPATVFGLQEKITLGNSPETLINGLFRSTAHGGGLLHAGDPEPVVVRAGRDIRAIDLGLPKRAEIAAGRDIVDIHYEGQNVGARDVSRIQAGGALTFGASSAFGGRTGIRHGGPGFLLVQAGEGIDLGLSKGIEAMGNQLNVALPAAGSALAVVSGTETAIDEPRLSQFFSDLGVAGRDFSDLLSHPETAGLARERITVTRAEVIDGFLGSTAPGGGALDMTRSKISTTGDGGDLYIVATGDVNVGQSTFGDAAGTGIFTAAGGNIAIYAGGDLNVNESRLMTFFGGDITVWSDTGDINAGRGAKTAISAEPPRRQLVGNEFVIVFTPPAVGSGIRTLTFDPDGAEGPRSAPPAGDVALFAPQGVIDAGEAGIAAANVILGATEVLNAENVSFSVGGVGVPAADGAAGGLGGLTGVSGLVEAGNFANEAASLASADQSLGGDMAALSEAFAPKWLKVDFIGFDEE